MSLCRSLGIIGVSSVVTPIDCSFVNFIWKNFMVFYLFHFVHFLSDIGYLSRVTSFGWRLYHVEKFFCHDANWCNRVIFSVSFGLIHLNEVIVCEKLCIFCISKYGGLKGCWICVPKFSLFICSSMMGSIWFMPCLQLKN